MAIMFDCLRKVASVININLGSTGHGFALLKQTMDLPSLIARPPFQSGPICTIRHRKFQHAGESNFS